MARGSLLRVQSIDDGLTVFKMLELASIVCAFTCSKDPLPAPSWGSKRRWPPGPQSSHCDMLARYRRGLELLGGGLVNEQDVWQCCWGSIMKQLLQGVFRTEALPDNFSGRTAELTRTSCHNSSTTFFQTSRQALRPPCPWCLEQKPRKSPATRQMRSGAKLFHAFPWF